MKTQKATTEASVEALEFAREELNKDVAKNDFFVRRVITYNQIVKCLLGFYKRTNNKAYKQQAFHYSERSKAQGLLDLLAQAYADVSAGVSPELQKKRKYINNEIVANDNKLQKQLAKPAEEQDAAVDVWL